MTIGFFDNGIINDLDERNLVEEREQNSAWSGQRDK